MFEITQQTPGFPAHPVDTSLNFADAVTKAKGLAEDDKVKIKIINKDAVNDGVPSVYLVKKGCNPVVIARKNDDPDQMQFAEALEDIDDDSEFKAGVFIQHKPKTGEEYSAPDIVACYVHDRDNKECATPIDVIKLATKCGNELQDTLLGDGKEDTAEVWIGLISKVPGRTGCKYSYWQRYDETKTWRQCPNPNQTGKREDKVFILEINGVITGEVFYHDETHLRDEDVYTISQIARQETGEITLEILDNLIFGRADHIITQLAKTLPDPERNVWVVKQYVPYDADSPNTTTEYYERKKGIWLETINNPADRFIENSSDADIQADINNGVN